MHLCDIPIPEEEIDGHLLELYHMLKDKSRYVPLVGCGMRMAVTADAFPTGALDDDAARWSLCGAIHYGCRDFSREWARRDAMNDAICEANGIAFIGGDHPVRALELWERDRGTGRSHDEVVAALLATLKARGVPIDDEADETEADCPHTMQARQDDVTFCCDCGETLTYETEDA